MRTHCLDSAGDSTYRRVKGPARPNTPRKILEKRPIPSHIVSNVSDLEYLHKVSGNVYCVVARNLRRARQDDGPLAFGGVALFELESPLTRTDTGNL